MRQGNAQRPALQDPARRSHQRSRIVLETIARARYLSLCHFGRVAFADIVPDGKRVAYFRGRKLHGKALRVPEGYRGVVVDKTEAPKAQAPRPDEPEVVDLDAEDEMPLGALDTKAEFDEMVIWGHESMADTSSDPYVRGIEEWMKVAEKVRSVCGWKIDSYTDDFRYILMRKRGSELVFWGGGRQDSSSINLACARNTQESECSILEEQTDNEEITFKSYLRHTLPLMLKKKPGFTARCWLAKRLKIKNRFPFTA